MLRAINSSPDLESLQKELSPLERTVQSCIEQETGFRRANAGFNFQQDTTQLLMAACEKLVVEKSAMDRASFEEHTSDLSYLCKHFGTAINAGLSERQHRDRLHQIRAAESPTSQGSQVRQKNPRAPFFAFCCSSEFPPQQSWWIEASQSLCPVYQVLRAGRMLGASSSDLAPGDILFLSAGQRAPADGRTLIFSEGTAVDVSHITMEAGDVRMITSEATAAAIMASNNMVLKDSYLVSGALVCMVVRAPSDSLIPGKSSASAEEEEQEEVLQDAAVPPGMTMSACRSLFKQLCVKSSAVCRSFKAMVALARVQTLVCLLTPDLLDAGSVPKLVATAKRLSKGLVLVDCGCGSSAVASLAQEHGLEHTEMCDDVDASGAPVPESTEASSYSGFKSLGSHDGCFNTLDSRPLSSFNKGENTRLADFAEALLNKTSQGAVLSNLSQAGLTALCAILTEAGNPPLFAMGTFNYPVCFRRVVMSSAREGLCSLWASAGQTLGKQNSTDSIEPPVAPYPSRGGMAPVSPADVTMCPKAGEASATSVSFSRMQSSISQATQAAQATLGRLSSGLLDVSKLDVGKYSEIVVSVNSIGVVSEHADIVLLKSDLGCLAQALDLVSKGVPASVALAADARPNAA